MSICERASLILDLFSKKLHSVFLKIEVLAFHPEQHKGDLGETNMIMPVPVNW